ncbi:hypothetical protein C1H76_9297 [Elsinoe australis]|uniref:Survival motor neuron Tudor domain-containing protein n=1 Tax=Elsinoe australis TaxID=40998 RepID=A0A4U7AKL3_9PEZI|nr:hypothetical protein C1H76_9297 [Elsinoe australis]
MMGLDRSQRETWDDTELVDSWNDALEEYKKYHSIAAKGENIDELVRKFEEEVKKPSVQGPPAEDLPNGHDDEDEYMPEADGMSTGQVAQEQPGTTTSNLDTHYEPRAQVSSQMPQALLGAVQDENMRNLMMSWYYAGYYTGLLEGQQKAHADISAAPQVQR